MEAAHEVMSGNRMEIPHCASIFQKIMKTCWSHKREDRPEFKEILNWINEWETRQLFGNPDDPDSVTFKEEDVYHIIDSKRLNYTDINKAKLIMDENKAKLAEESKSQEEKNPEISVTTTSDVTQEEDSKYSACLVPSPKYSTFTSLSDSKPDEPPPIPEIEVDNEITVTSPVTLSSSAETPLDGNPTKNDKRMKTLEELWDTERQYVTDLEVIVNFYLIPLRDSLKNRESIMPTSEIPKIFSNVEQILSVNTELLTQLDISLEKNFDDQHICKILTDISNKMVKMCPMLRVYAEYCTNNPLAIETLNQCAKNPHYIAFENNQRLSTGKVRLDGFIAKPVQRVLKYPLFFNDLLKSTTAEDPARSSIQSAASHCEGLAKYINDHKNQKENRDKLQEIDKSLTGSKNKINGPSRIFMREGQVQFYKEKRKKAKPIRAMLFNDMLLFAKEKGTNSYSFKESFPTHSLLARKHASEIDEVEFKCIDKRSFSIVFKSEYEQKQWLTDIMKVIEEQTLKQDRSVQTAKALLLQDWK